MIIDENNGEEYVNTNIIKNFSDNQRATFEKMKDKINKRSISGKTFSNEEALGLIYEELNNFNREPDTYRNNFGFSEEEVGLFDTKLAERWNKPAKGQPGGKATAKVDPPNPSPDPSVQGQPGGGTTTEVGSVKPPSDLSIKERREKTRYEVLVARRNQLAKYEDELRKIQTQGTSGTEDEIKKIQEKIDRTKEKIEKTRERLGINKKNEGSNNAEEIRAKDGGNLEAKEKITGGIKTEGKFKKYGKSALGLGVMLAGGAAITNLMMGSSKGRLNNSQMYGQQPYTQY